MESLKSLNYVDCCIDMIEYNIDFWSEQRDSFFQIDVIAFINQDVIMIIKKEIKWATFYQPFDCHHSLYGWRLPNKTNTSDEL